MSDDNEFKISLDIDDSKAAQVAERQESRFKDIESLAGKMATVIEKQTEAVMARIAAETEAMERRKTDRQAAEAEKRTAKEQKELQRQLDAAKKASEAGIRAAQERTEASLVRAKGYATDFAQSMIGFASAGSALTTAFAGLPTILNLLWEGKKALDENGWAALKYRDALKDIAALRGHATVTNEDVLKFAEFQKRTGMGTTQAKGFMTEFESSVATATDKNMSSDEKKKLADQAALLAMRITPSGDTNDIAGIGKLAGTLARFQSGGTAAQVVAQIDKIAKVASLGEGSNAELFDQLNKVLTYLVSDDGKGLAKSPQEAMALVSLMSSTRPVGEAATGVEQLGRALRGFQHNMTHGGMGVSQADFLKKAGINEKQSILESFDKLFPIIAQAEASGRAPDAFLKQFFSSDEEVKAVVSAYRATKQGAGGQIRAEAAKPLDVAEVLKKEAIFTSSKAFRGTRAKTGEEVAKIQAGQAVEEWLIAQQEARNQLIGYFDTSEGKSFAWRVGMGTAPLSGNWTERGQDVMVRRKALENLAEQGSLGNTMRYYATEAKRDPLFKQHFSQEINDMSRLTDQEINDKIESSKLEKSMMDANAPVVEALNRVDRSIQGLRGGPITAPTAGGGRPTVQN